MKNKIYKLEHCCCNVKKNKETSICKECSQKGIYVKNITLKSLVKESRIQTIKDLHGFYFCETPTCKVVYFNNDQNIYLFKEDIKVRVGIKETEEPIPVCYCFGWTREKIFNQIKELGKSLAIEEISAKCKLGESACEINNPSGRCCLDEVNKVVKRGIEIYGKS